jgi:hypothetical protein
MFYGFWGRVGGNAATSGRTRQAQPVHVPPLQKHAQGYLIPKIARTLTQAFSLYIFIINIFIIS